MRMHILLDDALVAELDARAGAGGRSSWVSQAVRQRLYDERRWDALLAAAGSIAATGHEWDQDPAAWVAAQRRAVGG